MALCMNWDESHQLRHAAQCSRLRFLRGEKPPGMEIAAGEYGYDLGYFRRMLDAKSVDVDVLNFGTTAKTPPVPIAQSLVKIRL